MKREEKKQERTIRVRDRRARYQFSVHNRIIDEWFPIIGAQGYALYGLYSRMANKADERCWTAYSTIQSHMRMGPGTISDYNKLLVWCGLIHIEEGDTRLANDYYILDIPQVTGDVIEAIQIEAQADEARKAAAREQKAQQYERAGLLQQAEKERGKTSGTFLRALLKRLDKWEPLQKHWKENCKEKVTVERSPDQMSLFGNSAPHGEAGASNGEVTASDSEPGTSVGEVSTSDGEPGATGGEPSTSDSEPGTSPGEAWVRQEKSNNPKSTIHNNNPNQQSKSTISSSTTATGETAVSSSSTRLSSSGQAVHDDDGDIATMEILKWMGFDGSLNKNDKDPPTRLLLAWGLWVHLNDAGAKNPVGVARSKWRKGEWPSSKFTEFVEALPDQDIRSIDVDRLEDLLEAFHVQESIPAQFRSIIKS